MRNQLRFIGTVLTGGVLALAGLQSATLAQEKAPAGAADRTAADATPEPKAPKPLALPPGIQPKDLKEAGDIRNAFEAVTEAAFKGDAFDDITHRLVDADRKRVSQWKETKPDLKPLQNRIGALQKAWRAKYGKDFDLDERVVFGEGGYVAIAQGEVSDPAQLVGKWPVAPLASGDAQLAAERQQGKEGAPADTAQQRRESQKVAGGDVNLDKGRNVAVARFPASHGMPAIDASLIHELPDIWRFDIPDNVDGQKLHDNLLRHLNMLGDGSNWPADQKEAYRMVAHHVLMALYDVQHDAKGNAADRDTGRGGADRNAPERR